jgi:nucleotide-binding universal stress UspA family protein
MTTIVAGIDNSAAARPVLAVAAALAELLGGKVEALHVRENGEFGARAAAEAAGLSLHSTSAPVIPALLEAARSPDVAAVVLGARGVRAGSHPAGHVALQLARLVSKPLVIVPPDAPTPAAVHRLLVPLNGERTASTLTEVMRLASKRPLEIVVLHVHNRDSIPLFSDQRQHELEVWTHEFLYRHCPQPERVALEVRIGVPAEQVLRVAKETHADLIVLGWSQDLGGGHAAVVREVLERSNIPAMLIPIRAHVDPPKASAARRQALRAAH